MSIVVEKINWAAFLNKYEKKKEKKELKAIEDGANRLAFALSAPIVVPPMAVDMVTEEMKYQAQLYRMMKVLKEEDELASDYETMLYLSMASLDAPLDREAYNVYVYLFRKFKPEQDFLGNDGITLEYTEQQFLQRLKSWIYNSQMKTFKEKSKT